MTRIPVAAERARLKDGVHIELSPRRVRAYFDNQLLVDSERVLLDSRVRVARMNEDLVQLRDVVASGQTF